MRARLRTVAGSALLIAGLAALTVAGVRYTRGALRASEARRIWDEQEAHAQVLRTRALAQVAYRPARPVAGVPVARLVIPRLGLDDIVLEGVDGDELNAGPGHLPGSAFPGAAGNAVISAHRDRHFHRMDELQPGDTILTESGQQSTTWVVTGRTVVGRNRPALFAASTPTLTLTTCWPIRYIGPAPDRLILTAHPVGSSRGAELERTAGGNRRG
ncbi:MAG TPA: class D sortase [Gemmatimonadaceae bacterium]|nr:class D sortase [Gemmatimonadaceae bacterium]